ncbi:MAG TPA: hypothetical protein VFG00_14050 [Acidothermaceae bacterium]|nr:hypothetical protein [Acidothermaceae bacterium]
MQPSRLRGSRRWALRLVAVAALGGGSLLAMAGPAAATFTTNTTNCAGSATIVGTGSDAGKTVSVNANDAKVTMLREGDVHWEGSVPTALHDNQGDIVIHLGLISVTAKTWGPSKNASNKVSKSGVAKIPSALKLVPPGTYHMTGYNSSDEGTCAGSMDLRFTGSILSSPVGIVAVVGTIIGAIGIVFAGIAKALP